MSTASQRLAWAAACKPHPGTMGAAYQALDQVLHKWRYAPERGITGAYNCRPITGGTSYSLHAYADGGTCTFWNGTRVTMAVAVDINWSRNPYGPKLVTDMPRGMVEEICAIRTTAGVQVWGWGGYYAGNKDAMHFELQCTPAELSAGIRRPKPIDVKTKETDQLFSPQSNTFHIVTPEGLLWDLPDQGKAGDRLTLYPADGGVDQRWQLVTGTDGIVSLRACSGTLALDAPGPWAPNTPLTAQPPHGREEQRFALEAAPLPGEFRVRHHVSGLYVTARAGAVAGSAVLLADLGVPGQLVRLVATV